MAPPEETLPASDTPLIDALLGGDPEPEPQVQEPVVEKAVMETHDSDDMGMVLKDEESELSEKKRGKKKSRRNPSQG